MPILFEHFHSAQNFTVHPHWPCYNCKNYKTHSRLAPGDHVDLEVNVDPTRQGLSGTSPHHATRNHDHDHDFCARFSTKPGKP